MINLKSQNGAIALYALVSLLALLVILLSIYIYNANKQIAGLEVAERIKTTYEKDVNNVEQVYQNLVTQQ